MTNDKWAIIIGMALCAASGIIAWNTGMYIRFAVSLAIFWWGLTLLRDED